MCKSGCGCGICAEMKMLDVNPNGVSSTDLIPFMSTDLDTGERSCGMGTPPKSPLTVLDNDNFNAITNVLSFDYQDEDGNTVTHSWDLSTLAIDINVASMAYNAATGEIVLTETDGQTHTIDIGPPDDICTQMGALPVAAAVPAGALALYRTAAGVCGRAPFPESSPTYKTCAGTLTTAMTLLLAPTAFASGFTVNQEDAAGCATRADTYYSLARRSHTFGDNYMANDAQGYGSSVTGGLRNTTATAASYSHIGGGYDHSITAGTANVISGGRNNDITSGSYHAIVGGYNQNITGGNYHVMGGVNNNTNGGNYNTSFGNANLVSAGNAGFLSGQQNTLTTGNYVTLQGYSHLNTAGTATTHGGYDHTNTAGSYNSAFGFRHIVNVGQSTFQGGQSNRNRLGNYNTQLGYSHDNISGSGNFQGGYNQTNTGSYTTQLGVNNQNLAGSSNSQIGNANIHRSGNYSALIGYSHDNTGSGNTLVTYNNTNTAGNYNFLGGVNGINRTGNYNAQLGYSHDNSATGAMLFGYNNTNTGNYSVTIGRNLVNSTQDGIMIANTFQRLGFHGVTPIARQTLPAVASTAQLTTALRNLGLIA